MPTKTHCRGSMTSCAVARAIAFDRSGDEAFQRGASALSSGVQLGDLDQPLAPQMLWHVFAGRDLRQVVAEPLPAERRGRRVALVPCGPSSTSMWSALQPGLKNPRDHGDQEHLPDGR